MRNFIIALISATALLAQPRENSYAQQLVVKTMAAHPELQKMGLHAVAPGQPDDVIIACSIPSKIGKKSSPADLAIETSQQPVSKKSPDGTFYDLGLPLADAAGQRLGMIVMELRAAAAQNEADALRQATQIRDGLQQQIPARGKLFESAVSEPLTLLTTTPLPDVKGAFDHFAVDLARGRLFVAAEVQHTIEIFDLKSGRHLRSLPGVTTPHTIAFVPEKDQLLVADGGDASCKIFAGEDLHVAGHVPLTPGPDAGYYDAPTRRFYIGHGGKVAKAETSYISVISADEGKEVQRIEVPSNNLEAMALDHATNRLYVNMRDKSQVGVVDLAKQKFQEAWTVPGLQLNTPLLLDAAHQRLFLAGRKPGKFFVLNTQSGAVVTTMDCVETADDMAFDPARQRIYLTGAGGISIYHQDDPDHYRLLAQFPTKVGKTGTYVPSVNQFYIIHAQTAEDIAGLQVYRVND